MVSFELLVNGKRICIAGTEPINRVLGASFSWSHREPDRLNFHLGGILSESDRHFGYNVPEIGVGDEILIRVIETDKVDEPDTTHAMRDNSNRS